MGHIPHVFVPGPWAEGGSLPLTDDQVGHLDRVLRLRLGDPVHYTDGAGTVGEGSFTGVAAERGPERFVPAEPAVHLVCAPPRSKDRARFLVEKVAEVGATSLRWIRTEYTQARPPVPDRARAWADGALEQSRGAWRLELGETAWDELARSAFLVAEPNGRPLGPTDAPCTVVVGPEGGFSAKEVPNRGEAVTLGGRILRTETAALAAVLLARHR